MSDGHYWMGVNDKMAETMYSLSIYSSDEDSRPFGSRIKNLFIAKEVIVERVTSDQEIRANLRLIASNDYSVKIFKLRRSADVSC